MSKSKEIIRRYQLVKFIGDEQNDVAMLSIDRVPRHWIRYNIESGETVAKFPPPPYNSKQKQALLEQLIKSEGDPLPEWTEYPVQLVGHADTYKDSLDRLVTLETQPFAYTSESDTAPKQKASQIVEELKKRSLDKIMEVTEIEDEDSDDSEYIDNQNSSSSSEDSRARPLRKKNSKARVNGKKSFQAKKVSECGSTHSDFTMPKELRKPSLKFKKTNRKDSNAYRAKSMDSDSSRSNESEASKSSKMATLEKSQAVPQLHNGTKKKEEKKKVFKPKSIDSDCSKSTKSEASKSSTTWAALEESEEPVQRFQNISRATSNCIRDSEQNAVVTISKKFRDPALLHAKTSENTCDFLNIEHDTGAMDITCSEGTYTVQEFGELAKLADEQQGASYNELPRNKIGEVHHHFLKTSNFDESLSKASDTVRSAAKNYTEDTLLILSAIKGLSTDLKENTNAINNLCAAVRNRKVSVDTDSKPKALVLETDFDLPFKTLKDFKVFDNQLKDTKYREHCAASLLFYIDRDNHVTKSVTHMLRKFVGREVCMNFTAVKQVITTNHKDNKGEVITEKYFHHCLGQTIANAKDWDGARVERAKKEKARRNEKAREKRFDD